MTWKGDFIIWFCADESIRKVNLRKQTHVELYQYKQLRIKTKMLPKTHNGKDAGIIMSDTENISAEKLA